MNAILTEMTLTGEGLVARFVTTVTSLTALILLLKLAVLVGCVALFWVYFNRLTPFEDNQELRRNPAYLRQRTGIVAAQFIGMASSLRPWDPASWWELAWMGGNGLWVMLQLRIFFPLSARVIGGKTGDRRQREQVVAAANGVHDEPGQPRGGDAQTVSDLRWSNKCVATAVSAMYVMVGLVNFGLFNGTAPSLWQAIASLIGYTVASLALLILLYRAYCRLMKRLHGYSILQGIRDGEAAASYDAAGFFVANGVLMASAVSGDYLNLRSSVQGFVVALLLSVALTIGLRWIVDKVIMVGYSYGDMLRENNADMALGLALVLPTVAFAMTYAVPTFALLGS